MAQDCPYSLRSLNLQGETVPVKRNISLNLEMKEVLRRVGLTKNSNLRQEIEKSVLELLTLVDSGNLLEPAFAYELYPVECVLPEEIRLVGDIGFQGRLLPSLLPKAKELAVVVCTIGPALEKQAKTYFDGNERLRGVLLDGIGSAAVDSLSQEACRFIMNDAESRGYQASSPISPGMPGFSIREQPKLLKIVPADTIGVSIKSSGTMFPRKSESMVIGIGLQMATWKRAEVCARCNLKKTCLYRMQR
jgi:hypothetical protein